jgi:DNA ligase-associated metallophosphoesterase
MLEIDCAEEQLQLLPEKAVFWPHKKMLIIADLHLGKPAAFRQSGVPVPESTTADDLARLGKILEATAAQHLVILGDFFHAIAGLQTEMLDAIEAWRQKHSHLKIFLVLGNHDKRAGRPPDSWNLEISETKLVAPFLFQHEPGENSEAYVLSGHVHPAISISEKFGSGIRAPCFCFGDRCAIFPAFGSFTGMRNIKPRKNDRIFAVGDGEVIEVTPGLPRFHQAKL